MCIHKSSRAHREGRREKPGILVWSRNKRGPVRDSAKLREESQQVAQKPRSPGGDCKMGKKKV